MPKLSIATVLLALALAACGGNDDAKSSNDDNQATPTSSEATPTPTSDAPGHDVAADQAIVDAAVLTIKDMPAGWTAAAPDDDDDDSKTEMAECVGANYDELYNDAHASVDSDDFTSPDDTELSMSAGLAVSEEWMTRAFEISSSPKFRECTLTLIKDEFGAGEGEVEVGDVSVDEMSFDPIGDEVTAFRMTMALSSQGLNLEAVADFVAVRVGRGQVLTTALSLGSPMSAEDLAGFAQISVDRLRAGLAAS